MFLTAGSKAVARELFPEWPVKAGELVIQLQSGWYKSNSNYTTEWGTYKDLPNQPNQQFQYVTIDPRVKYSFWPELSIEVFGDSRWAFSRTLNRNTGQYVDRTGYELTYAGAGFSLNKKFWLVYVTAGLRGAIPINRFDWLTENIVTGDGAYYIEPEVWITYPLFPHFVNLFYSTRFRYRTHKLSSLLYNKTGVQVRTRHLDFGLAGNLLLSVISDGYTNRPETRWNVTDRVNGGSYKIFSVNPSAISFTAWTAFKPVKNLSLNLFANLDVTGTNYGRGLTVGLMAESSINTPWWKYKSEDLRHFEKPEDPSKKYFEGEEVGDESPDEELEAEEVMEESEETMEDEVPDEEEDSDLTEELQNLR